MTAPLLSPTDISPSFEYEDWLQPRLPAARNTPPNVDYSEFAAALSNTFSITLSSPPSGHSFSLPTRTLPYAGISETFTSFDLPGNGSIPFYTASTETEPASDQDYGFAPDISFAGLTEDMMMEQARYNSWMDILSDYQYDSSELLVEAPSQNPQENIDCLPINDISNVTNMLDCCFSSQPGPQLALDQSAIYLSSLEDNWQSTVDTPSGISYQSDHLSPSQWMAGSNHELERDYNHEHMYNVTPEVMPAPISFAISSAVPNRSAPSQEARQGKPKPNCKAAVFKKKQTCKTFINTFATSTGTGFMIDGPNPNKRRRRNLDDEEREKAALIRKLGACEKCRKGRRSCARNQARFLHLLLANPYTLNLPCMFLKFEEAQLFRLAPSKDHPMRCSDEVYQSLELSRRQYNCIKLHLTQDYGSELVIEVAQFDPQPGDKTAHTWQGGEVELPPYCIVGINQASQRMLEYVRNSRSDILLELLSGTDDVTREVLSQAISYARDSQNSLVQQALDLLAATRIIERDWRICGTETLGIPVIYDLQNPWSGQAPVTPVTPVMDAQLDQMVTKAYLLRLRDKLLASLQQTMYAGKKEDWFSVFLSTFIYLTHIECLLQHSRRNAKRYGVKRRYISISLAEEYFKASRIALAHFHFVSKNAAPLQLDWKKEHAADMAHLDSEQASFMSSVLSKMGERKRRDSLRKMKANHQYEEPLYFCHQLFEETWEPGKIVIHDEVVV